MMRLIRCTQKTIIRWYIRQKAIVFLRAVYIRLYTPKEKNSYGMWIAVTQFFSLRFFSVFCPPKIKLWWEIMHKRVKHKHHIHPSILEGRKKGQHRWSRNNNNDMIWSASMCLQNCTIKYKGMKIIIFFLFWMKRRNCKRPTNGLKATQFFLFRSFLRSFLFMLIILCGFIFCVLLNWILFVTKKIL